MSTFIRPSRKSYTFSVTSEKFRNPEYVNQMATILYSRVTKLGTGRLGIGAEAAKISETASAAIAIG